MMKWGKLGGPKFYREKRNHERLYVDFQGDGKIRIMHGSAPGELSCLHTSELEEVTLTAEKKPPWMVARRYTNPACVTDLFVLANPGGGEPTQFVWLDDGTIGDLAGLTASDWHLVS